jgi:hypothetical protein
VEYTLNLSFAPWHRPPYQVILVGAGATLKCMLECVACNESFQANNPSNIAKSHPIACKAGQAAREAAEQAAALQGGSKKRKLTSRDIQHHLVSPKTYNQARLPANLD